ncbi:preprotein translocase subunit TatB [Desulforamulus profundi]|uniref:Preprotein translocase subunit TatB n=1 Tax=Desulforamulus profundi TaxID=1383067 RepID=A0A2C6MJ08_9FIRM|nr:sulfurtransferase TusA family protein [Desulforamulus profundi]MCL5780404.1 sulfurtransferase TusA family protein [Bacillota bacterium]PHJ39805.1 preprotein translocase subunit TatB [Desulforamulus profundi]
MKKIVDARGLSCPEPVILTRQALQEQGVKEIKVMLDNKVAVENVTRAAENLSWKVKVSGQSDNFLLELTK